MTLLIHISLLILVTTAIHGVVTTVLVQLARAVRQRISRGRAPTLRFLFVPLLALAFLLAALVEASLWAWYYLARLHLESFQDALYFSIVTMTTLGYGDITLVGAGRLVSGMQAALGIVLFGWTTAAIFTAVQAVHTKD